jgi:AraC-like DNA-binding protein
MEHMIDWVEENMKQNPTLTELSNHVGYSPFYCSNKFHEYVGITLKQYIAKRRLSLVAQEMKSSNRRCLDIALDYGFSSQEALIRAFTGAYGFTPKQYRKHNPDISYYGRPDLGSCKGKDNDRDGK